MSEMFQYNILTDPPHPFEELSNSALSLSVPPKPQTLTVPGKNFSDLSRATRDRVDHYGWTNKSVEVRKLQTKKRHFGFLAAVVAGKPKSLSRETFSNDDVLGGCTWGWKLMNNEVARSNRLRKGGSFRKAYLPAAMAGSRFYLFSWNWLDRSGATYAGVSSGKFIVFFFFGKSFCIKRAYFFLQLTMPCSSGRTYLLCGVVFRKSKTNLEVYGERCIYCFREFSQTNIPYNLIVLV